MRSIVWEEVKYDGTRHRLATVVDLGTTADGRWLYIPTGTPVEQPNRGGFTHPCDAVVLVPADGWWTAVWLAGHEPALYIDVSRPVVNEADRVVTMDLDVDVVRHRDGAVEVLDLDEFELHRRRYGYADNVVATVERVTAELVRAVGEQLAPFGRVPAVPLHPGLPVHW